MIQVCLRAEDYKLSAVLRKISEGQMAIIHERGNLWDVTAKDDGNIVYKLYEFEYKPEGKSISRINTYLVNPETRSILSAEYGDWTEVGA